MTPLLRDFDSLDILQFWILIHDLFEISSHRLFGPPKRLFCRMELVPGLRPEDRRTGLRHGAQRCQDPRQSG
jgi:hypothetical protein